MIEIDTKNIGHNINDIDNNIKKYIENSNDFYNELSKLSSYWKGYDYDNYSRKILKQMENDLVVTDRLKEFNNIYKNIQNIYEEKK